MIEIGDVVPLTVRVRTAAGALVDPSGGVGAVVLTVTRPDGTTATPTVTKTGVGIYSATFTAAVEGIHTYRWLVTDPLYGNAFGDLFTVDGAAGLFVSVDEALAHMRAASMIVGAGDIEELRRIVRVACDAVERDLDRWIAPRTVTETYDGGSTAVVLARTPIISVTSVTDSGLLLDPTAFTYSTRTGVLYRGGAQTPARFTSGRGTVSVVYRVGYERPPWIARQVALRGVQRMWQQSQQMPHPALDDLGAEGFLFTPTGVLTPLELEAYGKLRNLALA